MSCPFEEQTKYDVCGISGVREKWRGDDEIYE